MLKTSRKALSLRQINKQRVGRKKALKEGTKEGLTVQRQGVTVRGTNKQGTN
jgi:hypothetical protein